MNTPTPTYTDLDAANARIAALEAQLAQERAAHAETRDRLAKCNAAYTKIENLNVRMRRYIGFVRGTLENTTLRDANKVALIGLKAEYEHAADVAGVDPDPAEGDPEPVPILMERLGKRIGCKPQGAGDRVKALAQIGVARREEVHSGGRTRILAAPVRQALTAPASVTATQPRKWGGERRCPECGSERLRVTVTLCCEDCGTVIKTRHRLLNPDAHVEPVVLPVAPPAAAADSVAPTLANLADVGEDESGDAASAGEGDDPPVELFPPSVPAPLYSCRMCASEGIDSEWRWYGDAYGWCCTECDRPAPDTRQGGAA